MSVKAYNKEKESFVKIASLQSRDIAVDKAEFVSSNVNDALSELKRDLKSMQSNIAWIYNNGTIGGGGGSGTGSGYTGIIQVENFDSEKNLILQDAEAATVVFKVASKLNSSFSVKITIGATTKTVNVMPNVSTTVNMGQVSKGTHEVIISGEDYTGFPMETWRGYVIKGLMSVTSTFNSDFEYGMTSGITVPFQVELSSAVSHRPLFVSYSIDGGSDIEFPNVVANKTSYIIVNDGNSQLKMGQHKLVITAKIPDTSGINFITSTLEVPFLVYDLNHISIYVPNTAPTTYKFNNTIALPFGIIAHKTYTSFNINYEVYQGEGVHGTRKEQGSADFYRGTNMSIVVPANAENGYAPGKYTLRLWGTVKDQNVPSVEDCFFTFELTEQSSSIDPWSVVDNGLIAYFDARTQTSLGPNSTWTNKVSAGGYNISCVINNPMEAPFVHSAAIDNPQENNLLRLFGESYGFINFNPFAQGLTNTGFSIEFVYRCSNNGDYEAVIASCAGYAIGDSSITMQEGFRIDANAVNTTYSGNATYAPLMEDEWIHCVIVYEPMTTDSSQLFTKIYLNGVLSAAINSSKTISTINPQDWKGIFLGARYYWETQGEEQVDKLDKFSDVEFKNVKIYSRALNQQEVVINYIADDYYMHYAEGTTGYDSDRNVKLRSASALDDQKQFNVANSKLPRVYVWFDNAETLNRFKAITADTTRNEAIINEQIACYVRYENAADSANDQIRFDTRQWNSSADKTQINNTYIKVQGTTSLTYNHKNYDISFGTWADSNKDVLFSPKWGTPGKQWLPENTFTLKADLIDSSHSNNVGTAKAIAAISEEAGLRAAIPPMIQGRNENHQDIKFAIDGFPCLLYVYDDPDGTYFDADQPGTPTLYGVYMFDLGRTSYYNLGMKNVSITTMDSAQGNIGCIATDYTVTSDNAQVNEMYYPENTLIYEGNTNGTSGSSISFETTDSSKIALEWDQRYPTAAVSTGLSKLQTAIANVYNWDTGSEGADQFDQLGIWHKSACITYLLCAYVFGMVDNLGKNMQLKTWDGTQWFPMFYDLDTVLGLNNTGTIYYGTNIDLDEYGVDQKDHQLLNRTEAEDSSYTLAYGAEGGNGHGNGLYNTAHSKLWNAVRSIRMWNGLKPNGDFADDSFRYLYKRLRTNTKLLDHNTLYEFYSSIMDEIGLTFFNIDAETKYLDYYTRTDETGKEQTGYNNLSMMHGTRELLTKRWLRDRLRYLDSLFEVYTDTPSTSVTLQTRNSWNTGYYTTSVKTTCPVFTRQLQDAKGDAATKILLTDKYYFTPFVCEKEKVTNYQFLYNNANLITHLRGINTTQLGELLITTANSLIQLDVSNSTQLTSLSLEGLNSLRYFNCSYCPFGGTNTTNSLNLSKSTSLQEVDISYSGITNMVLPTGGTLKKVNASNTKLTALKVVTQTMLQELDLSNCGDLAELELTKCNSLKRVVITNSALTDVVITACPSLEEVILRDNKRLKQVQFEGCDNIKIVDLSGCTLSNFATYTGEENVDKTTSLNLSGCPKLEELYLRNCSAQVIRLPKAGTSLKKIDGYQSKWMQTIYTSEGVTEFSTWLHPSEGVCPAIDLGNFKNLESITFQSNAYVKAINNLTYAGNGNSIFRYCSELMSITGHITLTNNNQYMFGDMSSKFRLNRAYPIKPTSSNAAEMQVPLKISFTPNMTQLYYTFASNSGVTLYDAYYVCALIPSSLTTMNSTFYNTNLQTYEYKSENVSDSLLESAIGLVNASAAFAWSRLTGVFPSTVLKNCTRLTVADSMFSGNAFTTLDSTFSSKIFATTRNLTSCNAFLNSNLQLKNDQTTAIKLSELFAVTSALQDCSYFLGLALTDSNSGYTEEDSYINVVSRRNLYIQFDGNGDELFANTPNLKSCAVAFPKCKSLGIMSENIFGGINANKTTAGKQAFYPTGLTNVSYCFHDSDVAVTLTPALFSKLGSLTNVAGFISGNNTSRCDKVTGDMSALSSMFMYNSELTNVRRFFEATKVTGQIPSGTSTSASPLFANNTKIINANNLFKNATSITGGVPANLFGNCDSLSTANAVYYGCTGLTEPLPGAGSDEALALFKCLTTSDNKFKSLTSIKDLFRGCSNMYTMIPDGIFVNTPNITNVSGVFRGCGTVDATANKGVYGAIPNNLLASMKNLVDASYLFSGCWKLANDVNGTRYSAPVDNEGNSTLFANNPLLENVEGLFQSTVVYNIPADLFKNNKYIANVSYMFNLANRSSAQIPSVLFDMCPNINTIRCFAGESGSAYNPSYSLTLFPANIFKQWDGATGQKNIKDVFCAFRNNNNTTNGASAIEFWNWNNPPTSFAGCYHMCNVSGTIPAEYTTSA